MRFGPFVISSIPLALVSTAIAAPAVQYVFTGQPGTQASTAGTSLVTGVSASAITRGAGLGTGGAAADSFNGANFATGAALTLANNDYFNWTMTLDADTAAQVNSVTMHLARSGQGPGTAQLYRSYNSGAVTSATATITPTTSIVAYTPALSGVPLLLPGDVLEFRLYGWNTGNSSGSLRFQHATANNPAIVVDATVNHRPDASVPGQSVGHAPNAIPLGGFGSDPDAGQVLAWALTGATMGATISPSGSFSWDTTLVPDGIYTFSAIVTDNPTNSSLALSRTRSFTVEVIPAPGPAALLGLGAVLLGRRRRIG